MSNLVKIDGLESHCRDNVPNVFDLLNLLYENVDLEVEEFMQRDGCVSGQWSRTESSDLPLLTARHFVSFDDTDNKCLNGREVRTGCSYQTKPSPLHLAWKDWQASCSNTMASLVVGKA